MAKNPRYLIVLGFAIVVGACASSPSGLEALAQPIPVTTIQASDPTEYEDGGVLDPVEIDQRTLVCGLKRFYIPPAGNVEILDVVESSRPVTCYATVTTGDTESAKSNLIRIQCIGDKCFKRK